MRRSAEGEAGTPLYPLITHDPVSGGELIVTRLESRESGVVIEGAFSLGWMGRLTPEQLEFVGHLVRGRGNVQKVAADLNIAYNTARNRLDEIVVALDTPDVVASADNADQEREWRAAVLQRLAKGEIEFDEAIHLLEQ